MSPKAAQIQRARVAEEATVTALALETSHSRQSGATLVVRSLAAESKASATLSPSPMEPRALSFTKTLRLTRVGG